MTDIIFTQDRRRMVLQLISPRLVPYDYHPSMKLREGNTFTRVCPSVNLSIGVSHVTINHHALKLTAQTPSGHPRHGTSGTLPALTPLLVISGGHYWRSIHTSSLQDPTSPPPHISADKWWSLKKAQSAQVRGTHTTGIFSCFKINQPP